MALHRRHQIRHAAVAALKNQTLVEDRVVATRRRPWMQKDLPAMSVYTVTESVDPESRKTAPRELERHLQLAIEAAVKDGDDVDDVLDALALEIERVIHQDETFGGLVSDTLLEATDVDVIDRGDQNIGALRLVFAVRYYTGAPEAEDTHLDDFVKADIRTNLDGGQEPGDQAHDIVDHLDEA